MKIIGVYRKCDFVTMSGTLFALSGIMLTMCNLNLYAIFCLILAAICDAFDGVVARKGENTVSQSTYGCELDSLSDAISFGVLPMSIVFSLTDRCAYISIICALFALAGVIRLAYFNMLAITKESDGKEFIGLPITASAIILPIVYFIVKIFNFNEYVNFIYPVTLLITGIMFVSPFRLKKPSPKVKFILSIIGVLAIIVSLIKIFNVL